MIFKYAFTPAALIGGGAGAAIKAAISQGVKRGLFSNEAGMGSTPHAHAQADVKKPHDQGVVAMIGVFIDTFVVLTITALVVISTLYVGGDLGTKAGLAATLEEGVITKSNLMQTAVGTALGNEALGNIIIAVCLTFFAFTTIISWNFFGKQNVEYLFGKKATIVYSVIAILAIFAGSLFQNDLVWELADMFNNIMVIPNVLALIPLGYIVVKCAKKSK
jgi:AGCS family alanine or glycine:cation symporter